MTFTGFPDRSNSNSHILRTQVRTALSVKDQWMSLDDICEALVELQLVNEAPRRAAVSESLKVLVGWGTVIVALGQCESRLSKTKNGKPRKVKGWKTRD